jgi:uncharacterized protein YceK
MRKIIPLLISATLISGCAGVTNETVPTGRGTYLIARHGTMGWSSAGAQKAKALQEAAAFCQTQGKDFETVSDRETDSGFGKIASAEIEFRCIARKAEK